MTERYIIDDAGTLIDMETRNTYDYIEEILPHDIFFILNDELSYTKPSLIERIFKR